MILVISTLLIVGCTVARWVYDIPSMEILGATLHSLLLCSLLAFLHY